MLAIATVMLTIAAAPAAAEPLDLQGIVGAGDGSVAGRIMQLFGVLTLLSIAPGILVAMTSFTRFTIALSMLRSALGLQSTPSNLMLVALAMFMTWFVMAPAFDQAWTRGLEPLSRNEISGEEALKRMVEPFGAFMRAQVRPADLELFQALARRMPERSSGALKAATAAAPNAEPELRILVPAFMISELRRGFEIGFLIALPFLIIDLVVATVVMSMGMMMLPPNVISLPFKVLFFVLIDGWSLLVGSLVRSFH